MGKRVITRIGILSIMLCMLFAGSSYAEEWKEDEGGKWYLLDDGSYPRSGFYKVGESWYHFDENGYMDTGWVQSDTGSWYYMDDSTGALLRSTTTPDGYYVDENGKWDGKTGSGTQTDEEITIEIPEATGFGTVKGNVTWQYNNYIGTKADVGAIVYLIPLDFSIKNGGNKKLSMCMDTDGKNNVFYQKVDGYSESS